MRHVGLTDELIKQICEFVSTGSSFKNAYLLSGVKAKTGQYWRSKALEDEKEDKTPEESIYIKLADAMDTAKQQYVRSLVDCVTEAGRDPKYWQAAMTMVERIDPENYSRFNRLKQYNDLDIDPKEDTPVEIISKVLTAIVKGKISAKEGEQIANIIGALVKTEEATEVKEMLTKALSFRDTLKKGDK